MAHVLAMAAVEIRDPDALAVQVKSQDRALHAWTVTAPRWGDLSSAVRVSIMEFPFPESDGSPEGEAGVSGTG